MKIQIVIKWAFFYIQGTKYFGEFGFVDMFHTRFWTRKDPKM